MEQAKSSRVKNLELIDTDVLNKLKIELIKKYRSIDSSQEGDFAEVFDHKAFRKMKLEYLYCCQQHCFPSMDPL